MKKGFTLVEILIVVAVIAILLGALTPRFKGMKDEANIAKAKAELATLQAAIESYYVTYGRYPPISNNDCDESRTADCVFPWDRLTQAKPQIISSPLIDPFRGGNGYQYRIDGAGNIQYYVIYSVGVGNGYAYVDANGNVTESDTSSSCIYVSNSGKDQKP